MSGEVEHAHVVLADSPGGSRERRHDVGLRWMLAVKLLRRERQHLDSRLIAGRLLQRGGDAFSIVACSGARGPANRRVGRCPPRRRSGGLIAGRTPFPPKGHRQWCCSFPYPRHSGAGQLEARTSFSSDILRPVHVRSVPFGACLIVGPYTLCGDSRHDRSTRLRLVRPSMATTGPSATVQSPSTSSPRLL